MAKELIYVTKNDRVDELTWVKGDLIIKANKLGYENISEVMVCALLSSIRGSYDFIKYTLCDIDEDGTEYSGCYYQSYLKDCESLISINDIFKSKTGKDIEDCSIDFVYDTVQDVTGLNIRDYTVFLSYFNCLIYNEDNGFNTNNLIYNSETSSYRLEPIHDNSMALLSDIKTFPLGITLFEKIWGSPVPAISQSELPNKLVNNPIVLNRDRLERELANIFHLVDTNVFDEDDFGFEQVNTDELAEKFFLEAQLALLLQLAKSEDKLWIKC